MTNKKVEKIFSEIVPKYDLLNHCLSLNMDKSWRRFTVNRLNTVKKGKILDLATGTADVAIEMAKRENIEKIFGADFSPMMLNYGQGKINKLNLNHKISLNCADALHLPFKDRSFAGVTIAFGLRNLPDREKGLKEMFRVLKKDGKLLILEFTTPPSKIFKTLYFAYLTNIIPLLGGIISQREAYQYLSDSIMAFPKQEELADMMRRNGFKEVKYFNLTFGTVAVHEGLKQ